MDISGLFSRFKQPRQGVQAPRNVGLDHVCGQLTDFAYRDGWEITHGSDYRYFLAHRPEAQRRQLSARVIAHFNTADEFPARKRRLQNAAIGFTGYASRDDKVIVLPKEEGLVERMAARAGLDAKALKYMGLMDEHLYAFIKIHEVSHLRGESSNPYRSHFTFSEFHTNMTGLALFLQGSGFTPDHPVPAFITSYLTFRMLGSALEKGEDTNKYGWIDHGFEWINKSWQKRDSFWDSHAGAFLPHVFDRFAFFGDESGARFAERPFGTTMNILQSFNAEGVDDPIGTAVGYFSKMEREEGCASAAESVRILRHYRDAMRALLPYVPPDSKLAADFARYLSPEHPGERASAVAFTGSHGPPSPTALF